MKAQIIIATALLVLTAPVQQAHAFAPETDPSIVERYQTAQVAYQGQLNSYKSARDNWKDFRTKHKDLTDPTQALIAVEEAKSYTTKALTAYKAYLTYVHTRLETLTSVDPDGLTSMLSELDTAIAWLDTKLGVLASGSWTLESLKALASEFTSFCATTKTGVWAMVDYLLLSRIDVYLSETDGLLPLMDQALEAQSSGLTVSRTSSLRGSIASIRTFASEVRTSYDTVKALIVPEADQTTLQGINTRIIALNDQVTTLKKMIARLVAPSVDPVELPADPEPEETVE